MSAGDPLDGRLKRALSPYFDPERAGSGGIILAVSGGPDSIALLHAAATSRGNLPVSVATVDHGLRAESPGEASAVAAAARVLGLDHHTLRWEGVKPVSGIQSSARAMRYKLLRNHARAIGARLILTAHHADDQAETILMRLLKGSGPAGLVGMSKERVLVEGVELARPFLSLAKAELVGYCEEHGLAFLQDSSNHDDRYLRTRLRALMPLLAKEGLNAARLGRLAARLARDERALICAAEQLDATSRRPAGQGMLAFDGSLLLAAPEAVVLRLIDNALGDVSAGCVEPAPVRLERLERLVLEELLPALRRGEKLRRTLRGVLAETTDAGMLILAPAPPRRTRQSTRMSGRTGSMTTAASDLLGKGPGAAYIGGECVASSPAISDARAPASPDRGQ